MSSVPAQCQSLADSVATLEATDQTLRNQLASQTGPAAWSTLAQIGENRLQLSGQRVALAACVSAHTAALQGNLVVMDVTAGEVPPPSQMAHLFDLTANPAQRDSAPVTSNFFAFNGPLPGKFGISVVTGGDPSVVGPDFRSVSLQAASVAGPLRVEVLLCPEVQLSNPQLSQLVSSSFVPVHLQSVVAGVTADLSVLTVGANLSGNMVTVTCGG
jgi:hypothetical protein